MKPCPCGNLDLYTNYSIRGLYSLYCTKCQRSLTSDGYGVAYEPLMVWVHGQDALPCTCPACHFPPEVEGPDTKDPKVFCNMPQCPFHERRYHLDQWNQAFRPWANEFERLLKRWRGDPEMMRAAQALKRAILRHKRGRFLGDPKEPAELRVSKRPLPSKQLPSRKRGPDRRSA